MNINKFLALAIVLCMMFVGCGEQKQADYGDNYNTTYDAQNFSAMQIATGTENGFYVIQEDFVCFVDKKTGKTVPLCGKPNCRHNDSSCNAFYNSPLKIQAYNGNIYVVARGIKERTESLYRMSLDGSNKEEVKELYTFEESDTSCSLEFMIHRGFAYMVTNWIQKDRTKRTQSMYRISLDSSEEKEEIAKVSGYVPLLYINEGKGNKIYFNTCCYMDEDEKQQQILNYEYDILQEKVTPLNVPEGTIVRTFKDNRYYCYKEDGTGIISCDEKGENKKELFDWKYDDTVVYHDEKYFYIDNEVYLATRDCPVQERKIAIINYDGEKVCEWEKFGENNLVLLWSDSQQLLIQDIDKSSYRILDLEDISSLK